MKQRAARGFDDTDALTDPCVGSGSHDQVLLLQVGVAQQFFYQFRGVEHFDGPRPVGMQRHVVRSTVGVRVEALQRLLSERRRERLRDVHPPKRPHPNRALFPAQILQERELHVSPFFDSFRKMVEVVVIVECHGRCVLSSSTMRSMPW